MGGIGGDDVLTVRDVEVLLTRLATAEGDRDRARDIAVALEQECAGLRQALAALADARHIYGAASRCPACGPAVYARSVLDRTDPYRDTTTEEETSDAPTS